MGAFSKLQAYMFAALLAKDFTKWPAYELGVIDENGKLLKKPSSIEEKNSLDVFENLIRKIKLIILKFAPSAKYLAFIAAAYLLKEEQELVHIRFKEEMSKELTESEINTVYTFLETLYKKD